MIGRVIPGWLYDRMTKEGVDTAGFIRAEWEDRQDRDKVVRYLNRESRRAAGRARRRKG